MKRKLVTVGAVLLAAAGLAAHASVRHHTVARFTARSVGMTSPARLAFSHVEITIAEWSTDQDHRRLVRALRQQGPAAFMDALCASPAIGWISVAGNRDITVRYAWQAFDRDGTRRVFVASDEPIALTSGDVRTFADPEPLYFMELQLDARGDGIGKRSDARRLSADDSRNVIEMRDFDRRPVSLMMVHEESEAE